MPDLLPPAERSRAARVSINTRWSRVPFTDRPAATKAARDARWRGYLDRVPASVSDPDEREQLARQAHRADMQRLSRKAVRARRANAAARRAAAERAAAGDDADYRELTDMELHRLARAGDRERERAVDELRRRTDERARAARDDDRDGAA
jgi:hypothetical protein